MRTIAVIKHAALGDLVLTRPFLRELRRHFPAARLMLGLASNYQRGAPLDLVDDVHLTRRGLSWPQSLRNYRELGEHDLVFDLTATARSRWLLLLNRAGLKVGLAGSRMDGLLCDIIVPRNGFKYEAESFLDLLQAVGLPVAWPPDFGPRARRDRSRRPYVLYFVTASTPEQELARRALRALIAALAAACPPATTSSWRAGGLGTEALQRGWSRCWRRPRARVA